VFEIATTLQRHQTGAAGIRSLKSLIF